MTKPCHETIKSKNNDILYESDEVSNLDFVPSEKTVTIVAAIAENNELGKDNDLIWHISEDLKRFKRLTTGHAVIMGRKTFESMPKALPNRRNIILTRNKNYTAKDAEIVHTIEEALALTKEDLQPFVIGGGEIYRLLMPFCHRIELTRVHHSFNADTFFPKIKESEWEEVNCEKNKNEQFKYSYLSYKKIK